MALIKVDYDSAIAKANELQRLGDELNAVINGVGGIASRAEGIWQGNAEKAFAAAVSAWQGKARTELERINATSAAIKRAVESLKAADEKSKSVFV